MSSQDGYDARPQHNGPETHSEAPREDTTRAEPSLSAEIGVDVTRMLFDAEDVEPTGALIDLNPVAPVGHSSHPPPPWRSTRMDAAIEGAPEHSGEPEGGPSQPRPRTDPSLLLNGIANGEHGVSQRRGDPSPITPMFSLNDLLATRDVPTAYNPPTRLRTRRTLPIPIWRSDDVTTPTTYLREWEQSGSGEREENGSWEGAIDAARRSGYVPQVFDTRRVADTAQPSAARLGAANQALRRIARLGLPRWDPEEALPGFNLPNAEDDNDAEDAEEHPWLERAVATRERLYAQENRTGDDLDGWGRADGTPGSSLRRGRNNRRREPDSPTENVRVIPLGLGARRGSLRPEARSTGLPPTNLEYIRNSTPLVVRSGGARRRLSSSATNDRPAKKRRLDPTAPAFQPKKALKSPRPSYLRYTTLDPSVPLPSAFEQPLPDSFLAVTLYHPPSDPNASWPMITFTSHRTPTRTDNDACAIHTSNPIPLGVGIYYYEVVVLDQGEEGFMSVGWMRRGCQLARLVGWDKGSWGWHGDDGRLFQEKGTGENFGEKWGVGDTVGCGLDYTTGRAFFTKNGKLIGHRWKDLPNDLHPAIGLRTVGESLAVNLFGPFEFDIESYACDIQASVLRNVTDPSSAAVIPRLVDQVLVGPGLDERPDAVASTVDRLPRHSILRNEGERAKAALVLNHLKHSGHDRTLQLVLSKMADDNRWLPKRVNSSRPAAHKYPKSEWRATEFPNLDSALTYLHHEIISSDQSPIRWQLIRSLSYRDLGANTPDSTAADDPNSCQLSLGLKGRLRILDFLRVLRNDATEAIALGESLARISKEEKWDGVHIGVSGFTLADDLREAFGLVWRDPSTWGEDVVAGLRTRNEIADGVVAELRRIHNLPQRSYLTQAFAQTRTVLRRLAEMDGSAAFVDIARIMRSHRPVEKGDAVGRDEGRDEGRPDERAEVEVKVEDVEGVKMES